jgi:polar amino acid transport system substrate-binding protein
MLGYRMLSDNLFGVTQTIIVPKGRPEVLAAINGFIDEVRASGFLQNAITKSEVVGLEMAPAGATLQR